MLEFKISGEDAWELCSQMATLATILDLGTRPWENPEVKAEIKKQQEHKTAATEITSQITAAQPIQAPTTAKAAEKPAQIQKEEKPTATVTPTGDVMSLEEFRPRVIEFGRANGNEKVAATIAKFGGDKLSDVKPEDRKAFLAELGA